MKQVPCTFYKNEKKKRLFRTVQSRIAFFYIAVDQRPLISDQDPTSKQTFISYYVAFILVYQSTSIPYKWDKYPIRDIPTE